MTDTADPTTDLLSTTDAQVWAREWCRIAREIEVADDGRVVIDEGWMISWFANALEVGRSAGRKELCPHPADRLCVVADDLAACLDCGFLIQPVAS